MEDKMEKIRFTVFDYHGDIVLEEAHIAELAAYVDNKYREPDNKRKPTTILKERRYTIKTKILGK